MHVQHVLLSLEPGGLENGVVNVVNGLNPSRFVSSICCLKHSGEFASRLSAQTKGIHELGWRGGTDLGLPLRLASVFRRTQTDVVHTRNATAFLYGVLGAKLAGVPTIVHSEHGRTFDDRKIRLYAQKFLTIFADAVFAVSAQLKHDVAARVGIPAADIGVLYNGVDLSNVVKTSKTTFCKQIGVDEDTLIVGSVGRLVAVKNYGLFLRSIAHLRIPNVAVVLIGEGPERNALELEAARLGIADSVHFLGHREDAKSLLSAFDVFVLPSFSEGLSNTILEAMAARVPVIASNVGGNPELVQDGATGFLFENNDIESLSKALKALLVSPIQRNHFAAAGRERVERDFSMETMISNYEAFYENSRRRCRVS